MKKLYQHDEITYDLLNRNVGSRVTINAFGLSGEVVLEKDDDGDIYYEYPARGGMVRAFWLFYKDNGAADGSLTSVEVDEQFEVDWNEAMEHPIAIPGDAFFESGGPVDILLELNRMLTEYSAGNYFDYELVNVTDDDSFAVLYFHTDIDTNEG